MVQEQKATSVECMQKDEQKLRSDASKFKKKDDQELRSDMVEYIQFRLKQKQELTCNKISDDEKHLCAVAKLIEAQFYKSAKNREEYVASPDSDTKMKSAAIKIIRQHFEKRPKKLERGFRTTMRIRSMMKKREIEEERSSNSAHKNES